jgi:hypothetical protein
MRPVRHRWAANVSAMPMIPHWAANVPPGTCDPTIILVFKYLLNELKSLILLYTNVNFNVYSKAPKNHLIINSKVA